MSEYHGESSRDSSPIRVSISTLDVSALIATLVCDSGLRDNLWSASVLIIPTDLQPQFDGPAFPETTLSVLDFLREELEDTVIVDAIAEDDDYAEFAYRSQDIVLPHVFIANEVLLPVVVGFLVSFLNGLVKRRSNNESHRNVSSKISYRDGSGKIIDIEYHGPAETFERALSEVLSDTKSPPEDKEYDNK